MDEILKLKNRIAQLEQEENDKRIKAENQKVINFFKVNKNKDLCMFTIDKKGNMETLHVVRVEEVRIQAVFGGRDYLCIDTTSLTIGYDYKTQGFNEDYLRKDLKDNPQRYSTHHMEKSPTPIEMRDVWGGGIPLKSKSTYQKEYARILDTGKIQTKTNTFELKNIGNIGNFIMGKSWINPEVFDGMMQLYVKQSLESAEFMQNLPKASIFEQITF